MAKRSNLPPLSPVRTAEADELTLTQMLHRCGYMMSSIIQHEETPPAVRVAMVEMLTKIRAELNTTAADHLASIEAFYLFAPMVNSLSDLQKAA